MEPAATSVRISNATRDRIAAIAQKGETMEDAIVKTLDAFEHTRTRQKLAWEARIARATANPEAVAWGNEAASQLASRAQEREAGRP